MLGGRVIQQTVGIPMGTNCAPLLMETNVTKEQQGNMLNSNTND
jgi:hypothetical protein